MLHRKKVGDCSDLHTAAYIPTSTDAPDVLTPEQAAALLGISLAELDEKAALGDVDLPTAVLPDGALGFHREPVVLRAANRPVGRKWTRLVLRQAQVRNFLRLWTVEDDDARTPAGLLYERFVEHRASVQPGTDPPHAKAFAALMREVGVEHRRFTSGQFWVGIRLLAKRTKPTRREPSVEALARFGDFVIDLSDLSS